MIEIIGLNKRQKVIADILWNIEDWNQVEIFMKSLPKRDRIDCEGILELMRMAVVEEYAKKDGYLEANDVINRIRKIV